MEICVFCGSNAHIGQPFRDIVENLGYALATRGHNLVFGGYETGLMASVAQGTRSGGGRVIGVIPADVRNFGKRVVFDADELIEVHTITERKEVMKQHAQAYIAAPGSYGTFDELFEVLVEQKLATDTPKPIAILNTAGYFDPFYHMVERMHNLHFMPQEDLDLFYISDRIENVLDYLEQTVSA